MPFNFLLLVPSLPLSGYLLLQFASFEKVKEIDEFFKAYPNPSTTRTLKQSIERVQINAKWVESVKSEKNLADAVKELAYRKY